MLPATGCQQGQLGNVLRVLLPAVATILAAQSGGSLPPGLSASLAGGLSGVSPPSLSAFPSTPRPRPPAGTSPGRGLTGFDNPAGSSDRARIGQLLDQAAARYQIPPDILKGVAYQESAWRADASSFDGGHGKGVMQIDDRYHEFARTAAVWDPVRNIDYGARYLRQLYDETGSWEDALERYNGGSDYPPLVLAHARDRPWTQFA